MADSYDVFGSLNEFCNGNMLADLGKGLTVPSEESSDDDFELQLEKKFDKNGKSKVNVKTNQSKDVENHSPSPAMLHQTTKSPAKRKSAAKRKPTKKIAEPTMSHLQNDQPAVVEQPVQEEQPVGRRTRSNGNRNSLTPNINLTLAEKVSRQIASKPRKTGRRGRSSKNANADVTTVPETVDLSIVTSIAETGHTNSTNPHDVMRAHRRYIAERAAYCKTVDFVDLVTSPLPRIEGVVNVDADDSIELPVASGTNKNHSLELSFDDENPSVSVKIVWNGNPEVFELRKYQKLAHIYNKLAEREQVDVANVVLNLNNKILTPNDTPASIDYKIFEFINGRILMKQFNTTTAAKKRDRNKITLKIQSDQWKRPLQIELQKTEKFKILYIKCGEELNVSHDKFTLSFDGDLLDLNATPVDFELEGGEAIDLRFKK